MIDGLLEPVRVCLSEHAADRTRAGMLLHAVEAIVDVIRLHTSTSKRADHCRRSAAR